MTASEEKKQLLLSFPKWSNPQYAAVQLWKDVSKRICACAECHKPIPKRSRRIVMVIRRNRGNKMPNGAFINKDTLFFHPRCITDTFKMPPQERVLQCADCRGEADGKQQAFINKRYVFGYVCDKCVGSGRWIKCGYCQISFPAYMVERIVRTDEDIERLPYPAGCHFCVTRNQLYTANDWKKDERKFESYRSRIKRALRA